MTLPGLPQPKITKVDCGACNKCCKDSQMVILVDGENPQNFECHELEAGNGLWVLNHKENGDCVYLTEAGCGIWGKHPQMCASFDCAQLVRRMDTGAYGVKFESAVLKEGRKRLREQEKR